MNIAASKSETRPKNVQTALEFLRTVFSLFSFAAAIVLRSVSLKENV